MYQACALNCLRTHAQILWRRGPITQSLNRGGIPALVAPPLFMGSHSHGQLEIIRPRFPWGRIMDGECCAESPFAGTKAASQDGQQSGDLNLMNSASPRHGSLSSIALGALMVAGLMPIAMAETPVTAAARSDELAEVVITAERTTQNLQRVPISATVLSGEQLENEGVHRVADLQLVAPSLSIATYNLSTFVNIRGLGMAQSAPTSTPRVP